MQGGAYTTCLLHGAPGIASPVVVWYVDERSFVQTSTTAWSPTFDDRSADRPTGCLASTWIRACRPTFWPESIGLGEKKKEKKKEKKNVRQSTLDRHGHQTGMS